MCICGSVPLLHDMLRHKQTHETRCGFAVAGACLVAADCQWYRSVFTERNCHSTHLDRISDGGAKPLWLEAANAAWNKSTLSRTATQRGAIRGFFLDEVFVGQGSGAEAGGLQISNSSGTIRFSENGNLVSKVVGSAAA